MANINKQKTFRSLNLFHSRCVLIPQKEILMTVSSRVWWGEGVGRRGKRVGGKGERVGDGGGGGGDLKIRSKKLGGGGGGGGGNMGGSQN